MAKTVEFRGCDNLVIAEITNDDNTGYVTGAVEVLAPVAEVSKTVESSSETHYYDNTGMIVIQAEGSDTITLTVPALPLAKLATVTGKVVDPTTGAFIDCPPVEKYYALGYRLKLTDGTYRYVWRMKGSFAIPDETSATEDNGTTTNNQQLTYTGINTAYEFTNGGGANVKARSRGVVIDERDGLCDCSTFFSTVQTPDTVAALAVSSVTALSISPTTSSLTVGGTATITPTTTPSGKPVAYATSNPRVATVSSGGVITAVGAGTAVITATAGAYSASCAVTVTTA